MRVSHRHVLHNLGEFADEELCTAMIRHASGGETCLLTAEFVSIMTGKRCRAREANPLERDARHLYTGTGAAKTPALDPVQDMFNLIDEDESGSLDASEVSKLASKMGGRLKPTDLVDAMSAMDPEPAAGTKQQVTLSKTKS